MATALENEIRRRRIEDALLLDTPNLEDSSEPDKPDTADKDVYGDWRKWPSVSPEEAADIPTIEQPAVPVGHVDLAPPGHIDLTPPSPQPPQGIQTDPESGQRYVADPTVPAGIVPYAELATPADKEAFKPTDVTLPKLTSEGAAPVQPAPDKLDQVERATLVAFPKGAPATVPWHPAAEAPDTLTQVERGQLVKKPPAPDTLTQVERALPTGPKAPGTHTELAPPGQMDLRPDELPAQQPAVQLPPSVQPAVKPVADNWKTWITTDGTASEPSVVQSAAADSDLSQVRSRFAQELADNSDLRRKLIASVQAEVGDQGEEAKLAYIESVMNRAAARGQTLDKTISDSNYYPVTTLSKLGYRASSGEYDSLNPIIERALGGSNLANFATGNESGNVHSHGAQVTYNPKTGERFVLENPDAGWEKGISATAGTAATQAAKKQDWESWATLSPAEQTAATAQGVQKSQDILNTLQSKSTNMPDWFHTLEQPIPGVSNEVRTAVRDEYKKQITAYAQDYYKEPDPDKAFARIMSAPNLLTSAGEIWTKAGANFQHMWLSLAQQADSPTQTKLIEFINAVHPEATPEARTVLINQVMSEPAGKARTDFVNHLYNEAQAHNPDSVKNINMMSLLDSIDVSAQPGMQAKEAENHARVAAAVEQNRKNLREDPTMEGTYGGVISNAIAQMPKNVLEAIVPVLGQSAMFSEIYTDTLEGLRKDHPDWSEDQLKAKAAAASLPQDILQELVNAATLGMGSGVTKGITNPIARIATNAIMHGTIAGGAGATQQALANVATGRPPGEGVAQAGIAGGIQGLIGGALTGRHPAEAPESPVPAPHPFAEEKGSPLPLTQPATREGVLGPDVPDASVKWYDPTQPIVTRGTERTTFTPAELAEQAATVTGRTPEELQAAAEQLKPPADFNQRAAWFLGDESDPEIQQAQRAQRAQAPSPPQSLAEAIRQQKVAASLGATETPMPQAKTPSRPGSTQDPATQTLRSRQPHIYATDPSGRENVAMIVGSTDGTYHVIMPQQGMHDPARSYSTADEAQTAARNAFEKSGWKVSFDPREVTPQAKTTGTTTPAQAATTRVSEADPYTSRIANRYTAERMATGELGQIDPAQGQSTEHLVMQGLKMSPTQRESLIDNFTKGKGGDFDQQGAAIRSKEAILSVQSRDASRAAAADPTNTQLQDQAKAAHDAVTAFHNGPIKKFKKAWSDAGRGLQREIPLDYTTLNGMKEAYLKGKGNGKEAPIDLEPKLKQMADTVNKAANAERAAMNNLGKEIEARTRGNPITDEHVRTRLMEIMKNLPCRT